MKRPIFAWTLMVLSASALLAQQSRSTNPYEGVSVPPSDDIFTSATEAVQAPVKPVIPPPKPSAARYEAERDLNATKATESYVLPASSDPAANFPNPDNDEGIVAEAKIPPAGPRLSTRAAVAVSDPDGDIVHPLATRPGQLGAGTTIRVRLLERLSTTSSSSGESFRCRVVADVWHEGLLAIPAGAEIDGTVVRVTTGHVGGRGSMSLRPTSMVTPSGARYRFLAELTGTPDSNTHITGENTVVPNSRMKRNGVEYGGAVGGGAAVGAVLGGPAGALAGGLVGAGVITVHLLASHPQVTLESGATLMFTLTEPLELVSAARSTYN